MAVAFALVVRPTPPAGSRTALREGFRPGAITGVLARPSIAGSIAVATVGMYAFQSFLSFFPTFLIEYRGLAPGAPSTAFGATYVLSAALLPVLGRISDRTGRNAAIAFAMGAAAVGLGLFLVRAGRPTFVLAVIVLGVGLSWAGVLQSRFFDALQAGERGTGFGLARTVFVLLGSVGNVATGVLAERAGWVAAYGVVVGLLAVAALGLVGGDVVGRR